MFVIKSKPKRRFLAALSWLSAAALLFSGGAVPAAAGQYVGEVTAAAENPAAKMLITNDTLGTDISDSPAIYLDNSEMGDGRTEMTVTVTLADSNGTTNVSSDSIAYGVDDPNGSITVEDITEYGVTTSLTLTIRSYRTDSSGNKVPLNAGSSNITFSNKLGSVSNVLKCTVYSPASDMQIYWGGDSEPLTLNDLSPDNETFVHAVSEHTYFLSSVVIPETSTDKVKWAVYDGYFDGTSSPTATDKATITSDGKFTTLSEGSVTIVAKFEATPSSPRLAAYGDKTIYVDGGFGELETRRMKTVPKYIHVDIARNNPASSIEFTDFPSAMLISDTYQLEVYAEPSMPELGEATDVLRWQSSDPSVASVSPSGFVRAYGTGKTTITVYGEDDNVYVEQTLRVITEATDITIEPNPASTRVNVPIELTATMFPETSNENIDWYLSDDSIATIVPIESDDERVHKAQLTGLREGVVTVEAIAEITGLTTSCTVTIEPKIASDGIALSYLSKDVRIQIIEDSVISLYTNSDITINSEILDSAGVSADEEIKWTLVDDGSYCATVASQSSESLTLHGSSEGTMQVTAYVASDPSISRSFSVQVLKACDYVRLTDAYGDEFPRSKSLSVGTLTQIKAEPRIDGNYPLQHSDRIVAWGTESTEVAQIDGKGYIRAASNGTTRIYALTASGHKEYREINVFTTSQVIMENVTPSDDGSLPTTSVYLDKNGTGGTHLSCSVRNQYNSNVQNVSVEWSSSDESVATVDQNGNVTALSLGRTMITATSGSKSDQCMLTVYASLRDATLENAPALYYSPVQMSYESKPTITWNGTTLTEGVDYEIEYTNNNAPGTASYNVNGIGFCVGSMFGSFAIERRPLTDDEVVVMPIEPVRSNGAEQTPVPEIMCSGVMLSPDTDFVCTYSNNRERGTAHIRIDGKGNYTGTLDVTFDIYCNHEDMTEAVQTREATCSQPGIITQTCNICGEKVETEIPALPHTFEERVIPSTANEQGYTLHTCSVCGYSYKDNYTEMIPGTNITDCAAKISGTGFPYTGQPIEPDVTLTYDGEQLVRNADYMVTYIDNVEVGTGYAIVTGLANFVGTASISFVIIENEDIGQYTDTDTDAVLVDTDTDEDTDDDRISIAQKEVGTLDPVVYHPNKVPYEPRPVVNLRGVALIENVDYKMSYANNSDVGTATVLMTGIGKYKGTARFQFDILPKPLTDAEIQVKTIDTQICTGKELKPATVVVCDGVILASRRDYKITYTDNIWEGVATANITGIGNYTGTLSLTFRIECNHQYQEQIVAPTHSSRGYTLHTCTICGAVYRDNYVDQLVTGEIKDCDIKLEYDSTSYTGEARTPTVEVTHNGQTLEPDVDYTVSYSNNTKTGIANVTVVGKGAYTGLKTVTFQIIMGILGDVNFDGVVTADDALLVLRYTVGLTNFDDSQTAAADVNGDGTLTAEDSLAILRHTVGIDEPGSRIGK